ncbi:MAG TPA: hypothetical protein VER57_05740 [Cyanobium sp.]|nr:hypothetical protein [Cyanobium sp.]
MALLLPATEVGAQTIPPGGAPGPEGLSSKEQQVLERIRQMKTPPWRSFGPCRYDWGGWRLSDGGVRVTSFECGDPPQQRGSVAVHCETLRINRRVGEGAWEPWRLPYSRLESRGTGGEDLMVAALCANVRKGVAAPLPAAGGRGTPGSRSASPLAPGAPSPARPPARSKSRP